MSRRHFSGVSVSCTHAQRWKVSILAVAGLLIVACGSKSDLEPEPDSGLSMDARMDSPSSGGRGPDAGSGGDAGAGGGNAGAGGDAGAGGGDTGAGGDAGAGGGNGGAGGAAGAGGRGGSGGTGGGGDAGGTGGTGGGGPPIRTVIHRDIYADFDVPNNLMIDGGFEWSTSMATSWYGSGMASDLFRQGSVCRTGIRCGYVAPSQPERKYLIGSLTTITTGDLDLSYYVKDAAIPPSDTCVDLNVELYSPSTGSPVTVFRKVSSSMGSDGWCYVKGTIPTIAYRRVFLLLSTRHGDGALVDNVVVSTSGFAGRAFPSQLSAQTINDPKILRDMAEAVVKSGASKQDPQGAMKLKDVFPKGTIRPWIR